MVSVVIPAYNEEDIIEASVRDLYQHIVSKIPGAELIVVNDCSTDNTLKILQRLQPAFPGLEIITPAKNGGHGAALRIGFAAATQKYIFQTDSDRQHKAEEFDLLWKVRGEYDFVVGIRKQRIDGWFRIFITKSMRLLNFVVFGEWIRDANCPFKLMRRDKLQFALAQIPVKTFIPMVLVMVAAQKMKYQIKEVEITHLARNGGVASLKGIIKWMKVVGRCTREILEFQKNCHRLSSLGADIKTIELSEQTIPASIVEDKAELKTVAN